MRRLLLALLLFAPPANAADSDYEIADICDERPRILVRGSAGIDTMKVRCGITGIADGSPKFGTSSDEYAELLAICSAYNSTLSSEIGSYGGASSWEGWDGGDHTDAYRPMLNLTLAWLISGDSAHRTKMLGWLNQIVSNAESRKTTYNQPMLSFGADAGGPPSDYIREIGEAGTCHWPFPVWDALVDSLDVYDSNVADKFGEMCLALFVMAETDDDDNQNYYYTADRNRATAGVGAIAMAGEDARFDGLSMWDSQTYSAGWAATNIESGLDQGANQIDTYSLYQGTDSGGYTQTIYMMFWPLVALQNGTTVSPFGMYSGWAQHSAWVMYSTTAAFSFYGTHTPKGGSQQLSTYWSEHAHGDIRGRAPYAPDIAMIYEALAPTALGPQIRWFYDAWQVADTEGLLWARIAYDDATATRTQPTAANTPLTRHFGMIARPGDKMDPNIYEFGKFTSTRSDWSFAANNQTTLCIGYWAGSQVRAANDHEANGHLAIFHGTHSLQGMAGNVPSYSAYSDSVMSPERAAATVIMNRASTQVDNDGFGKANYSGGALPKAGPGVTDQYGGDSWRDLRHRTGVIERLETSPNGGYFRSDMTLMLPNPSSVDINENPEWSGSDTVIDSLIEDVVVHRNYLLRRSITHTLKSGNEFVQITRHMDRDDLVGIADGAYNVSDNRNGLGGGVAISNNATTYSSINTGTSGNPKRRYGTVGWPLTGYTLEFRGGPASNGAYYGPDDGYGEGDQCQGCGASDGVGQGECTNPIIPDPDPPHQNGWCDPDGIYNFGPCDPGTDFDVRPPWGGDERDATAGYSGMGVVMNVGADATPHIVTIEQIGAAGMTLADTRQATGFGDTLVVLVTEDPTTPIVWSMPRNFDDTEGMLVTDSINDDVWLEAWGLTPGEYYVNVEGTTTLDSVTVGMDGYVTYFIPNQGPTTQIELSLTQGAVDETPPDDPAGFLATTIGDTKIRLDWDVRSEPGTTVIIRDTAREDSTSAASYVDSLLVPFAIYSYQIQHKDLSGNLSAISSADPETTFVDGSPPSEPSGLTVSTESATSLLLEWDPSTDEAGSNPVWTIVEQDGIVTADSTTGVEKTITGLDPSTTYSYRIQHRDTRANSAPPHNYTLFSSPAVEGTTGDGGVPPVAAQPVIATALGENEITIRWGQADDGAGSGIDMYELYEVGSPDVLVDSWTLSGPEDRLLTWACADGLTPGTSHTYYVVAYDVEGNSATSSTATATTEASGDVTPPTTPTLNVGSITHTTFQFTWTPSSDPETGVVGYYLDFLTPDTQSVFVPHPTLSYTRTGLAPKTAVAAHIKAENGIGLQSPYSNTTGGQTLEDTTPPSIPEVRDFTATQTSVTFRWFPSTDDYSPPITYQAVLMDSLFAPLITTTATGILSATFFDRQPATQYYAAVRADDAAPNSPYSEYSDTLGVVTLPISEADVPIPRAIWYKYEGQLP